jgi:glycosyltransferase involved in cell wall biosynthesis
MVERTAGIRDNSITVVIPHISPRHVPLLRAIRSVTDQTHTVDAISVFTDTEKKGAGRTRNMALAMARTSWVAFLDDDDFLHPNHIEVLLRHALETGSDVVYSACRVIHTELGVIPADHPAWEEWGRPGKPFDAELLRQRSYLPVTSLVKTSLAQRSSFEPPPGSHYDDWGFYLGLLDLGATFSHINEVTWTWTHGDHNTSGDPGRW